MSKQVNGETYYLASEAAEYLGVSRDTFYDNVKEKLQPYKPGALKRKHYRQADLDKFRGMYQAEQQRDANNT